MDMSFEMKHEEYKKMLELAALDALDEAEMRALQTHLETCAECREKLDQLRDAAAALVYLIDPVKASPELRARILGDINMPRMTRPFDPDATSDKGEEGGNTNNSSSETSNVKG